MLYGSGCAIVTIYGTALLATFKLCRLVINSVAHQWFIFVMQVTTLSMQSVMNSNLKASQWVASCIKMSHSKSMNLCYLTKCHKLSFITGHAYWPHLLIKKSYVQISLHMLDSCRTKKFNVGLQTTAWQAELFELMKTSLKWIPGEGSNLLIQANSFGFIMHMLSVHETDGVVCSKFHLKSLS